MRLPGKARGKRLRVWELVCSVKDAEALGPGARSQLAVNHLARLLAFSALIVYRMRPGSRCKSEGGNSSGQVRFFCSSPEHFRARRLGTVPMLVEKLAHRNSAQDRC